LTEALDLLPSFDWHFTVPRRKTQFVKAGTFVAITSLVARE
jgi:hypothetical protein